MDKVLVCLKRVVDYNVRVRIRSDGSGVVTEGVKTSINPFDEIALEEALRIRERGQCSEVVAVSIGDRDCEQQLRTGLAMGADRALRIDAAGDVDPLSAARLLLAIVNRERPGLVLLGKQAVDDDNNQTGQMLAALWQRPQATFVSRLELSEGSAAAAREVDRGLETITVDLPAVVTTDLRLNQPRYVKLPEIMKAKSKPLHVISANELGVDVRPYLRAVEYSPPPPRAGGRMVRDVDELVGALQEKGLLP